MAKKDVFRTILEDTENVSREVWLRERKKAICGSDFPVLLGLSTFRTAVDLFVDKTNPDEISEEVSLLSKYRLDIGHALEPVMLGTIGLELGAIPIRDKRMVESIQYPYMRVDIDGIFMMQQPRRVSGVDLAAGELVLFEAKTVSKKKFYQHLAAPDLGHVAQCKFGMLVRGMTHCILAYSNGGNNLSEDLIYYCVSLTDEDRQRIPLILHEFWENVQKGIPPTEPMEADTTAFKKSLIRYYSAGPKSDEDAQIPTYLLPTIQKSLEIRQEISKLNELLKAKEQERDLNELPLVEFLGNKSNAGVLESALTVYRAGYTVTNRRSVNADGLDRLKEEHPEVFDLLSKEGYIQSSSSRSLYVKSKEKKVPKGRKK